MTKKRITAAELMARLNADPEFIAKQARQEQERLEREAAYRLAERPLVAELRAAGLQVESAWDLANARDSYPDAVPILLAHVVRSYPSAVREGIARALAVPETKAAGWDVLRSLYVAERDERVRSGLAVAIAGAADDAVIGDVIELARDTGQGPSRVLLLSALERSSDPRALTTLKELTNDPELAREIRVILKRAKR